MLTSSASSGSWPVRSLRWPAIPGAVSAARLACGQAEQQFVHDTGGEIAVQAPVRGLLLGQDDAGQRLPRDLDVRVGPQLAGGDAPADDRPDAAVPRLAHRLPLPPDQPPALLPPPP